MKIDNYTFINLEDANSVILNHGVDFDEYYDLDTRNLETEDVDYTNYRHDFVVVSKSHYGSLYEYVLEIRNSLWDGSYSFIRLPQYVTNPTVTQDTNNPNILRITGENLTYFVLRLHLSNYVSDRIFEVNTLTIQGIKRVSSKFYQSNTLNLRVLQPDGTPSANTELTVIFNGETETYTTDNGGYVTVVIPPAEPGEYYADVYASKDNYSIHRIIPVEKTKEVLMLAFDTPPLVKGAYNSITLDASETAGVTGNDLAGISIKIEYADKIENVALNNEGQVTFDINLRKYYQDSVRVKFTIAESDYTLHGNLGYNIPTQWFYAENYHHLKAECESTRGADHIRLLTANDYTYYGTGHDMIEISREIEIQGQKTSNGWSSLNGVGNGYFRVRPNGDLTLKGVKFYRANPAIYQDKHTNVFIDSCLFKNCENEDYEGRGACVATIFDTESETNKKLFYTIVRNSYFYNNNGSCFTHGGQLDIDYCYFLVDEKVQWKYDKAYVNRQLYGDFAIRNSKMVLDTGDYINNYIPESAKSIAIYLTQRAAFNGKTGKQIAEENMIACFDGDYKNESYLYLKFKGKKYPQTKIQVNSPKKGYEKKAIRIQVDGKGVGEVGTAYGDYDTDVNNTSNKWTIKIPDNGGWYVL